MTERLMNFPKFPQKEKNIHERYETYQKIINLHNQSVRYLRNIPQQQQPFPQPLQIQQEPIEKQPDPKIIDVIDENNTITLPISRDSNGDKVITLISSSNTQYSVVKDDDSNVKLVLRKRSI
jgi:hypothetical protein